MNIFIWNCVLCGETSDGIVVVHANTEKDAWEHLKENQNEIYKALQGLKRGFSFRRRVTFPVRPKKIEKEWIYVRRGK